jgi:alkanesulfonate monooxygenase SsuD/methylene tetrahydromethanopterin reductase-like flavin-dependent oxidoreductase (luciferase family)
VLVSLCLDPARSWPDLAALALRAETSGLQRVFLPDHFLPHHSFSSPPGPVHECWTTLSALASLTTRIGLGTLVLGGAYRHPAVVAPIAPRGASSSGRDPGGPGGATLRQ